jgi:hypothetical protein
MRSIDLMASAQGQGVDLRVACAAPTFPLSLIAVHTASSTMAHHHDEHEEARVLRGIAFKGLGLAVLVLGIVLGGAAWLAWGH